MKKLYNWHWLLIVLNVGPLCLALYSYFDSSYLSLFSFLSVTSLFCGYIIITWMMKKKVFETVIWFAVLSIVSMIVARNILKVVDPIFYSMIGLFAMCVGSTFFLRMAHVIKKEEIKDKLVFVKPLLGIGIGFCILGLYFSILVLIDLFK